MKQYISKIQTHFVTASLSCLKNIKKINSLLSLEEKIKIIFIYGKLSDFGAIRRDCKNHFDTEKLSDSTIRRLANKLEETDSVHDRNRPGRPHSAVKEGSV